MNRGAIAEQFVAQELIAYADPYQASDLYWWSRDKPSSSAKIDFVISKGQTLFPIEVKAGKIGKLRSLKIFMEEKSSNLGIRISQNHLEIDGKVLTVPLYLIEQLLRLVKSISW